VNRTDGFLLGGRVQHAQPARGFRSGIEPVLLAAAIPARPGQRVLEAGTGSGAALLCLAERVPSLFGVGVELDPAMAGLAQANARANDRRDLLFIAADIARLPLAGGFDHAFANPPYHLAAGGVSPDPSRERAKHASPALLAVWAAALSASLRHRGTLSFVLPAAHLPVCLAAMAAAGCAVADLYPFWPRLARPAKLMVVRGIRGGRMPMRLHSGLVLHGPDGAYSAAAERILRDGAALDQPARAGETEVPAAPDPAILSGVPRLTAQ
jgi:tRNA1(Val) A37 N6-methylase TrmN6